MFPPLQERLRQLQYQLKDAEVPTLIVLEGWDASGKGSIIGRLAEKLDPRAFHVFPGSPPSELEQRYHWLWRYQIRLPEDGQMALFDHSWYGRVLVERVEGFVKKKAWRSAYDQINEFERWLTEDGQVVVKFFFHISKAEQRRRLKAIDKNPLEKWRVQKEDWRRNRHYDDWVEAIEEMLVRTDTPACPWTIVEATDARWTRVKVFEVLVARMEEALARRTAAPAAVSRTRLASAATRGERQQREKSDLERARTVAAEAGMPIEE
ncbi:MAG: UDP-galactose-lipid carrier transferase [Vicinamibacteria bacterium]|nr:UDP-galactose-lipid carrier transferase [Vicinamibacteria bacterium]